MYRHEWLSLSNLRLVCVFAELLFMRPIDRNGNPVILSA